MRHRSILLAIVAVTTLDGSKVQAESGVDDRCRGLQRSVDELVEHSYGPAAQDLRRATFFSGTMHEAFSKPIGPASFLDSSEPEASFSDSAMKAFAIKYALPADIVSLIASERPAEFWRRANMELKRQLERTGYGSENLIFESLLNGYTDEMERLGCPDTFWQPAPATSTAPTPPPSPAATGPLPVAKFPAGHPFQFMPIITDDLISRWMKGAYSAEKSGVSPWQAAAMAPLDFKAVEARIKLFIVYSDEVRRVNDPQETALKERFSAEELLVLKAREKDIRNASKGNWSEVERM